MTMEKDTEQKLSARQLQVLDLLLAGANNSEAAAKTGVARETISRWRNRDADFQAAFNAGMRSIAEAGQRKVHDARMNALDRLIELTESENESIVLNACSKLLSIDVQLPRGSANAEEILSDQVLRDTIYPMVIKAWESKLAE